MHIEVKACEPRKKFNKNKHEPQKKNSNSQINPIPCRDAFEMLWDLKWQKEGCDSKSIQLGLFIKNLSLSSNIKLSSFNKSASLTHSENA